MRRWFVLAVVALVSLSSLAEEKKLAAGMAKGSFTVEGKETAIAYATSFVDQSDERKPTILILSDKELPSAGWKTSGDAMMYRQKNKYIGVAFWFDSKREVFRTDYYDGTPFPTSASGIFELKLDDGALTGKATSTAAGEKLNSPVKLDVSFNASKK